MASDEDYASFLERANAELLPRSGGSAHGAALKAVDHGASVPVGLRAVASGAFYASEADEAFEPVVLRIQGGWPDEGAFLLVLVSVLGRDELC